MIENTLWMTYFEYLPIELKQAEEEGKNVELYRKEIEEIIQTSGDMSFEEKERPRSSACPPKRSSRPFPA